MRSGQTENNEEIERVKLTQNGIELKASASIKIAYEAPAKNRSTINETISNANAEINEKMNPPVTQTRNTH